MALVIYSTVVKRSCVSSNFSSKTTATKYFRRNFSNPEIIRVFELKDFFLKSNYLEPETPRRLSAHSNVTQKLEGTGINLFALSACRLQRIDAMKRPRVQCTRARIYRNRYLCHFNKFLSDILSVYPLKTSKI